MSESAAAQHPTESSPPSSTNRAEHLAWLALAIAAAALCVALFRPAGATKEREGPVREAAVDEMTTSPLDVDPPPWRSAMVREQTARRALEASLRDLEAQLAQAIERGVAPTGDELAAGRRGGNPSNPAPRRGLDEATLVTAGFSPSDARDLKRAYDELQMEQLYARDRAARKDFGKGESWAATLEEIATQERTLADRYGEAGYDWMLYASGRPNRVSVDQIFEGSPAEAGGLNEGDIVLRYAEERIRNSRELRDATSDGVAGEWVEVEILRDERIERVQLPRGPLGITLAVDSVAPTSQ